MLRVEARSRGSVVDQMKQRYLPGPFAWSWALRSTEEDMLICFHCMNHARKPKRRQPLPMDSYVLGALSPQLLGRIDKRSMRRIERALREPENPFRAIPLLPLQAYLRGGLGAWWELNLHTEFFDNREHAKMIRNSLKQSQGGHDT